MSLSANWKSPARPTKANYDEVLSNLFGEIETEWKQHEIQKRTNVMEEYKQYRKTRTNTKKEQARQRRRTPAPKRPHTAADAEYIRAKQALDVRKTPIKKRIDFTETSPAPVSETFSSPTPPIAEALPQKECTLESKEPISDLAELPAFKYSL